MAKNSEAGRWGEAVAAAYLQEKHYALVETNYRSRYGEIDLIVRNAQYLVFVEVKLRRNSRFARAGEFVTAAKQERLRNTALCWLAEHETALQPRFDVIEVYAPEGTQTRRPALRHIENAFC